MNLILRRFIIFVLALPLFSACTPTGITTGDSSYYTVRPEEPAPDHSGMWLLPQIEGPVHSMMAEMGLQLQPHEIYSESGPSLNRAITRINIGTDGGGGTGSFVSKQGLLLTNHHVAYDGIASISGPDQNFLQSGFFAEAQSDEIPLTEYSLYIPVEQTEVTEQIQSRITPDADYRQRSEMMADAIARLIQERKGDDEDLVVEIDNYWSGNRQFMSVYKVIRDVRLVYAPEEAIGKFGGDIDNWMWPRHTGDFTFLRAYVSKDGSSAPYQPGNVPFEPDYYLSVHTGELNPGDFTMTLGFPGSTYRFESSPAFSFYEEQQFPSLYKAFSAYLKGLEMQASNNPETATANAAERASIANALKYYEGLIDGFRHYNIVERKKAVDLEFSQWAEADSLRNLQYGRVISQLEQSYDIARQTGDALFLTFYSLQFSSLLQMGGLFNEFYEYSQAPDSIFYSSEDRQQLYDQVRTWQSAIDKEAELLLLTELLQSMAELPEERRPLILYRFFDSDDAQSLQQEIREFMDRQSTVSVLTDTARAASWIFSELHLSNEVFSDSLYLVSRDIFETFELSRENYFRHFQYLEPAQKRYVEGMLLMNNRPYNYADANFTLRLSAGQVMGYVPADGVYYTPFTTYRGMLAKDSGADPFDVPDNLLFYLAENRNYGGYSGSNGNLILNFLSTNDITGGNSGSPVLNGRGEIIGLAFDGNIEGIVSDYYVVPDVARTISVDIRYILFLMDEIDQTGRLLRELDIPAGNTELTN